MAEPAAAAAAAVNFIWPPPQQKKQLAVIAAKKWFSSRNLAERKFCSETTLKINTSNAFQIAL